MTGHKYNFLYHIYFEVPILLKQNPPPPPTHTNAFFDRSAFGIFDVRTSNIVLQLRPDVVTFNVNKIEGTRENRLIDAPGLLYTCTGGL